MLFAVIVWPHSVWPDRATSRISLFAVSAMYSWPPLSAWTKYGSLSLADVAVLPFPDEPDAPVTLPATV